MNIFAFVILSGTKHQRSVVKNLLILYNNRTQILRRSLASLLRMTKNRVFAHFFNSNYYVKTFKITLAVA